MESPYRPVMPPIGVIYLDMCMFYFILHTPTSIKLLKWLYVFILVVIVIIILYILHNKINIFKAWKDRFVFANHYWFLKSIRLLIIVLCLYLGFVAPIYQEYDYSTLKENVSEIYVYDLVEFLRPIMPVPIKDSIQCCCDIIAEADEYIEEIQQLIDDYGDASDIPEEITEDVDTRVVVFIDKCETSMFSVSKNVMSWVCLLLVDDAMYIIINALQRKRYLQALYI